MAYTWTLFSPSIIDSMLVFSQAIMQPYISNEFEMRKPQVNKNIWHFDLEGYNFEMTFYEGRLLEKQHMTI